MLLSPISFYSNLFVSYSLVNGILLLFLSIVFITEVAMSLDPHSSPNLKLRSNRAFIFLRVGRYSSREEENYLSREGIFHTGILITCYYYGE
jgi:hypothetical protein